MEQACFDYLTNKEKKFVYDIVKRSKKRNKIKVGGKNKKKRRIINRKKYKKPVTALDQTAKDTLAIYGPRGGSRRRRKQRGGALPLLPIAAAAIP